MTDVAVGAHQQQGVLGEPVDRPECSCGIGEDVVGVFGGGADGDPFQLCAVRGPFEPVEGLGGRTTVGEGGEVRTAQEVEQPDFRAVAVGQYGVGHPVADAQRLGAVAVGGREGRRSR